MAESMRVSRVPTRGIKWMYLGVVWGAPVVHVMVSVYRKYPKHKNLFVGAIVGSTAAAFATRIILMYESGFMVESFPAWREPEK
jgi:hypothetical protein